MDLHDLARHRFRDDVRLAGLLAEDRVVRESLAHASSVRARYAGRGSHLADTIRVDGELVPSMRRVEAALVELLPGIGHVDCFVGNDPKLGAFVSADDRGAMICLTSGAVNALDDRELLFLVGHELGHVAFGHLDIRVEGLLDSETPPLPQVCMRLRAWQRAAEISADRVGRVLCGSSSVASRALFKTLSGLVLAGGARKDGLQLRLADQWERLEDEATATGVRHWNVSHPFHVLRLRAMDLYSKTLNSMDRVSELTACENEVSRMLAVMDPGSDADAERGADPLLTSFLLWGGLYVALADGTISESETRRIQSFAPAIDVGAYARGAEDGDGHVDCLDNFQEALKQRRVKLTAVELHRILFGLIDVATADGRLDERETERLRQLGGMLGVPSTGCDLVMRQYQQERERRLD